MDPARQMVVEATLADAIGRGRLAWTESFYPSSAIDRRHLQERFQKALADHIPVVMTWYVDFNSLDNNGRFFAPPAHPGRQGGHMVVMDDYEINNVPGFGTLKAGVLETRPEALSAALSDSATMSFIRIKNSWGAVRPDRPSSNGYYDLYMTYLNGPVKQCQTDPQTEEPKLDTCFDATPFESVILPPGY
jgi:hypothetical protein